MSLESETIVECKCDSCIKVRCNIKQIFRVLDVYGWLLDSYIVDFFLEDLWSKLPGGWQSTLDSVSPVELGKWILGESGTRVWPLSLIALRQVIRKLEINRNHNEREAIKCRGRENGEVSDVNCLSTGKINSVNLSSNLKHPKFDKLFIKHVKTKKRYEIEKIAKILNECTSKTNCTCVVDIGAGVGHLSRVLAFKYGLNVICIEQDSTLTNQAKKYDNELSASMEKYKFAYSGKIDHVSMTVNANNSGEQVINDLITNFANGSVKKLKTEEFGLIGLHPCGDLATTLLRLYSSCEKAKFICIVGCCYMKLTLRNDENNLKGFPMSKHVSLMCNNKLSFNALEVACHAVEKHCEKLKSDNYTDLVVHTYRAVLEYILVQKSPKLRRIQVKSVKVKEGMSFEQYCKSAIENLEVENQPELSYFTQSNVCEFLTKSKRVLLFNSLRLMLAPLVETCILLDRFLFLSEKGLIPSLKAEFDCKLSPRNFVLTSTK